MLPTLDLQATAACVKAGKASSVRAEESYHVIVESGRVRINKRNEFLHRSIERLQQLPHLSVEVMKLLVAVCQEANHRAKRCTLDHNNQQRSHV